MIRYLLVAAVIVCSLSACSSRTVGSDPVEAAAREVMRADGLADAAITQIVEGDPGVRGADALYCVATDATINDGQLPYLLVVWRRGESWEAAHLPEGYYEWDLQGCPR